MSFLTPDALPLLSEVSESSTPVHFITIGDKWFDVPEVAFCRVGHLPLASVAGVGPLPKP